MTELKEIIRRIGLDCGFADVRFASYSKLVEEGIELRRWLDKGFNASMNWMDTSYEKRIDPEQIMPDVRSIISLSYLYDTPYEHADDISIPRISRYAWGTRDYHKVIKKKLKEFCCDIELLKDEFRTRSYIDDGPVMDKAWAVRSGLGWMGKNTNVISKENGSFFFLATVLTNIDIPPDRPVEDLCKDCRLCVDSCPTGALIEDYRIDSNLCISYQTIENRAEEIKDVDLHGWIFGCDVCQDVCPFNRPGIFSDDEHFIPNKMIFGKSYDDLLKLSEDDFTGLFKGTPVMRTKYSGWRRNLLKAKSERKN